MSQEPKKLDYREISKNTTIRQENLPMLEVIFDRYSRRLSTDFRSMTSDSIEIICEEQRVVRFGEILSELSEGSVAAVFKVAEWGHSALLLIEKGLLYHLIDAMLGSRKGENLKIPDRSFTTIERGLIEMLINTALRSLENSFSAIGKTTINLDRIESRPSLAQVVRSATPTVMLEMNVSIEQRQYNGKISFLFPQTALKPVKEKLMEVFVGERGGSEKDVFWERYISSELQESMCELDAILGEQTLSLGELLKWKIGDTIPLRAHEKGLVEIRCGDRSLFSGIAGHKHNIIAIAIDKVNKPVKGGSNEFANNR